MAVDPQRRRLTVGMGSAGASTLPGAAGDTDAASLLANIPGPVWSITSITDKDAQRKKSFAQKDEEWYLKEGDGAPQKQEVGVAAVNNMFAGHAAWTCHKGLKPESPNQDSFSMTAFQVGESINYLYGVYDGHGPKGHDVSDMVRKVLVEKFLTHEDRDKNTAKAMDNSFVETQKQLHTNPSVDTSTSGSTCTLVYVQTDAGKVHIGHIGDSRCVQYFRKKASTWKWDKADGAKCKEITEDHKPNLPEEKKRIEAAGGRVVFDGFYNHRVFAARGMYPGLNMSRAFGDDIAHAEAGLTAVPAYATIDLKEHKGDEVLLVISSDGVWEFIESEEALKIIRGVPKNNADGSEQTWQQSVEILAKESYDRWMRDSDNEISDDITGIIVKIG